MKRSHPSVDSTERIAILVCALPPAIKHHWEIVGCTFKKVQDKNYFDRNSLKVIRSS